MKPFLRPLAATLALLLIPLATMRRVEELPLHASHLTCVLDLDGYRHPSLQYSVGFHYELLHYFALNHHCGIDVILSEPEDSIDNYLAIDSIDLVVRPWRDSLGYYPSHLLTDSTVWLVRDRKMQRSVNRWISNFSFDERYPAIRERFAPAYDPYRRAQSGRTYRYSGPYDDLVRRYAAVLGWDWHLLEALIWQESRFHIEARSHKGAVGLMQMIPSTARRYGVEDMLDPEENIRAGVDYLMKLQTMFSGYASGNELARFTLAAYNAGEGRILDCIRMARSLDMPCSTWEELEAVIPYMREESFVASDTVLRLGLFKGYETIAYIHHTDSLAQLFRAITP